MNNPTRIGARLDAETLRALDAMPGATRTEKLRNLIAQRGIVASLLDEHKKMLADMQKVVAQLSQNHTPTAPPAAPQPAGQNGVWTPQEMAALFQALALISSAVGKPAMSSEAANFCAGKVREIYARK